MRKSTIFIILLIGVLFVFTPTKSNRDNVDNFNDWRPDSVDPGCHDVGVNNLRVDGQILFDASWITVERGETFTLTTNVVGFSGNIDIAADSSSDITVGFNILDDDNSEFLSATIADSPHILDVNGDSTTPWITPVFTVPDDQPLANYSIVAYAVAGTDDRFDWIAGHVRVEVIEDSGPPGPLFELALGEIANDNVNVTIDIFNLTDAKSIQLAVDHRDNYTEIDLVSNYKYRLELGVLDPGEHIIYVNVTNYANASTEHEILIVVTGENITSSTTTSTTQPTNTSTQATITDKVDHGALSNPIVLGGLAVVMILAVTAPWILLRRS